LKLHLVIIRQDIQVGFLHIGIFDHFKDVIVALYLLVRFLYYGGADVVFSEVIVPLFLAFILFNRSLGSVVLLKEFSEFSLVAVLDSDGFLMGIQYFFFHPAALLYFFELFWIKDLHGLDFVDELFLVFVQKVNKFEILAYSFVHEEVGDYGGEEFSVVVVNFDHE
jgi:hypothetical protein